MNAFEYMQPTRLAEALEALEAFGAEARVLSGGTDLIVALREGKLKPRMVVDLKRAADLSAEIEVRADRIVIGARVRMAEVAVHPAIAEMAPALVEAAAVVGSAQIRHRATLAGNACNASPAADTVPVLVACGADVEIAGREGSTEMPLGDFIQGNRRIALRPGQVVAAILLPRPLAPAGAAFERMTRRRGVDLATVNACCAIDARGVATFAFGAVAPKTFVVRDAGELSATHAAGRGAVLDRLFAEVAPITDVRAGADYRRAMVRVLAERAFSRATQRLAGGRHA